MKYSDSDEPELITASKSIPRVQETTSIVFDDSKEEALIIQDEDPSREHIEVMGLGELDLIDITPADYEASNYYEQNLAAILSGDRLNNIADLNLENIAFAIDILKLTKLKILKIGYNNRDRYEDGNRKGDLLIININKVAQMKSLTKLKIRNSTIDNTNFLAAMTQLTWLSLRNNNITEIGFLKNLTNLKHLNLSQNYIIDISHAAGLVNLTILKLKETGITNLRFVKNLTKLIKLDICGDNIENFIPLLAIKLIKCHFYNFDVQGQRCHNISELIKHHYNDDISLVIPDVFINYGYDFNYWQLYANLPKTVKVLILEKLKLIYLHDLELLIKYTYKAKMYQHWGSQFTMPVHKWNL